MAQREFLARDIGQRLTLAADNLEACPPHHRGRLSWIVGQLESRFNVEVSIESVRKWLSGEVAPKRKKLEALAELFEVDLAWLSLGLTPELTSKEKRVRNARADGAVNMVAGLLQMHGVSVAFPATTDPRRDRVDLYAILSGVQHSVHVVTVDDGVSMRLTVPVDLGGLTVLALVQTDFSAFDLLAVPLDTITRAGEKSGDGLTLEITRAGAVYIIDGERLRPATTLAALQTE